ncbi:MAG: MATE family efflux transporter [Pirellulales bacterium]
MHQHPPAPPPHSSTLRRVFQLAMPVLAEQLLGALVMLVDFWLTGHFLSRQEELAAITLMAYCLWFLGGAAEFVGIGATAMVARFVGAGDRANARRVTNQAMLLGTIWSLIVMTVALLTAPLFVRLIQLEGETADLAERYLYLVLPALTAIMLTRIGIACLRGAGDMVVVFVVMTIVNVVNILVSAALVTGYGIFPNLGWDGLALGTSAGYVCGAAIVIGLLIRGRDGLKLRLRELTPDRDLIRRILRISIPGGTDTVVVIGCHLWFLSLIYQLGDFAAAAHGGAIRVESLAFLPGAAFAMASATLAGQYLGAGDPQRAGRSVMQALAIGAGIMGAAGVMFFFFGSQLVGWFLDDSQEAVAQQAGQLLQIAAFGMVPLAVTMILAGALRGAGDTRWPLLFTLIGLLAVRIPLAYLLTREDWYLFGQPEWFDYGILGAWYAMMIDIFVRCVLVAWRFLQGGWKRVVV